MIAQVVHARRGFGTVFMRVDRWAAVKTDLVRTLESLQHVLRMWVQKVRHYLVRLTTR